MILFKCDCSFPFFKFASNLILIWSLSLFLVLSTRIELEDFCYYFNNLFICCENPNFMTGDLHCQWKCEVFEGSWVAGKSAGGSLNDCECRSSIKLCFIWREPAHKDTHLNLIAYRYLWEESSVFHPGTRWWRAGRQERVVLSDAETSAEPSQSDKILPNRPEYF